MRWAIEAARRWQVGASDSSRGTIRLLQHVNSLKIELVAP